MKMAKKVLAVVLAVVMVAALSAMAFATKDAAEIKLTVGELSAKGKAKVNVDFINCEGLKSGKILFTIDDKVSKCTVDDGDDVANAKAAANAFTYEFNNGTNPLDFGFYFKENLYTTEKWIEAAEENDKEVDMDGANFKAAVFTFTAENGAKVTMTANLVFEDGTKEVTDNFVIGTEVVTTTAAGETTTAAGETTTVAGETTTVAGETTTVAGETTTVAGETTTVAGETTTVAGETTTVAGETTTVKSGKDDKPMGDNGVLAIVAGVCVLAGAAFVVTKKRK